LVRLFEKFLIHASAQGRGMNRIAAEIA
jgi:hypothetical protein